MSSQTIATKYLKLIVLMVTALICYRLYKSDIKLPAFNKSSQPTMSKSLSKDELEKQKQTVARIRSYENYLNSTLQDLKTLEASSSVDLNKDLHLDKLYLEDL